MYRLPTGEVHKLAKKKNTNIFPVRTEQASSTKVLLVSLYFKFTDSIALIYISKYMCATKAKTLLLLGHFRRHSAIIFRYTTTRAKFLLNAKNVSF